LQVPDYFRKNAADRQKKGSGTISGTKTILGEMAALHTHTSMQTHNYILKNSNTKSLFHIPSANIEIDLEEEKTGVGGRK